MQTPLLLLFDVQYLKYERIPIKDLDDDIVPMLVRDGPGLSEELSIRRKESRAAFKLYARSSPRSHP